MKVMLFDCETKPPKAIRDILHYTVMCVSSKIDGRYRIDYGRAIIATNYPAEMVTEKKF